MFACISTAHARTKGVCAFWAQSGPRRFPCEFLERLAQDVCSGLNLGRGIFLINFRIKWLLSHVDLHVDCRLAQSVCPRSGRNLGRGIFPVNFSIKRLLSNVHFHFDCASSRKMCVCVLGSIRAAAFCP